MIRIIVLALSLLAASVPLGLADEDENYKMPQQALQGIARARRDLGLYEQQAKDLAAQLQRDVAARPKEALGLANTAVNSLSGMTDATAEYTWDGPNRTIKIAKGSAQMHIYPSSDEDVQQWQKVLHEAESAEVWRKHVHDCIQQGYKTLFAKQRGLYEIVYATQQIGLSEQVVINEIHNWSTNFIGSFGGSCD